MDQRLRELGVSSNNIHSNKPAMMSDGRQGCSWLSEPVVDMHMKEAANIRSNWDYRRYLTSNATQIMSQSMTNEMYNNVNNISMAPGTNVQSPYNFKNLEDRTQVRPNTFSSDLKQMYLSRNEQQAKMYAPNMYTGSH